MKNNLIILISILLGLSSYFIPSPHLFDAAEVVGHLFLKFLKLISLPLIFLAIISSVSGMKNLDEMKLMGRKILKYTISTTLIAASIGLIVFLFIRPNTLSSGAMVAAQENSYFSFLLNIIPENLVSVFLKGNVLGIAFLGFILGVAVLYLKKSEKEILHAFFKASFNLFLRLTSGFLQLLPLGIWAFVTLFVRDVLMNKESISPILSYVSCIVLANLIQGFVVLPLFLKIKGFSPRQTFKKMLPALTVAFFTKSSNAALPVTLKCAEENLGVEQRTAKISLPLCSIINMNACAAFILITVLFVGGQSGFHFSFVEMVMWVFLASLAAIGNAGVPMGCYFLASAFLMGMGAPLSIMGLILPFYTLLDMLETALNVWSDSCIVQVVDQELKVTQSLCP